MNDVNFSRYFYFALFILLSASCSSEKGSSIQASSDQDLNNKSIRSIMVKGFSLGMDFNKAREQAIRLFEEAGFSKEITVENNPDNTRVHVWIMRKTVGKTFSIWLYKEKEDKLVKFEMSAYAVNAFFNSAQLSAREFFKEFAKNYGLPDFSRGIAETSHFTYTYWKYESKDGWYIIILEDKALLIEKIPEKKKPDFR